MDSEFQVRWEEYVRKKASKERKPRDRSSFLNPPIMERPTNPDSTSTSNPRFAFTAIPQLLFLGDFHWFARAQHDPSPAKLQVSISSECEATDS